MIRLFVMAACAALLGCASSPVTREEAARLRAQDVLAPALTEQRPGAGAVLFLRDRAAGGVYGVACSAVLSADGVPAARLSSGTQVTLWLPPGAHSFLLQQGEGSMCPSDLGSAFTMLAAGEEQVYRIMVTTNGALVLARVR